MNRLPKFAGLSLAAIAAVAAAPAYAGGFYLQEQSPVELGRAFSGEAASADTAATVFYNPAGMTELDGINVEIGGHFLFVDSQQRNRGTTVTNPVNPLLGPVSGLTLPVAGSDGGNPFDDVVVVPSGYVSAQVSDRLWVGLGVSAPFGLVVEYDDDFFGRYDSLRSDVKTYNIQPSVAFKISDNFSIGGGVDIQYIDVELTNALPGIPQVPTGLGVSAPDGRLEVRGDDWSVGWNVGATATFGPVRLGAHYRSQMEHELEGTYEISGLTGVLAAQNVSLDATAPITLPDIATVSVLFGVDKPLRFMGTWRYYNWKDFEAIRIRPEGAPETVSEQNYQDTWSAALGAEYDVNDRFTVRAGTMYDPTPTVDAFRSTRVPDGDRTWVSGGISYRMNDMIKLNLSYAHVFVTEEELDRTDVTTTASSVRSTNSGNADIVAASASLRF